MSTTAALYMVYGYIMRNLNKAIGAAEEIKDLINTSVHSVETGGRLVDEAGSRMDEITDAIRQVSGILADIARSSAEQGHGIAEVSSAVHQMDGTAQVVAPQYR